MLIAGFDAFGLNNYGLFSKPSKPSQNLTIVKKSEDWYDSKESLLQAYNTNVSKDACKVNVYLYKKNKENGKSDWMLGLESDNSAMMMAVAPIELDSNDRVGAMAHFQSTIDSVTNATLLPMFDACQSQRFNSVAKKSDVRSWTTVDSISGYIPDDIRNSYGLTNNNDYLVLQKGVAVLEKKDGTFYEGPTFYRGVGYAPNNIKDTSGAYGQSWYNRLKGKCYTDLSEAQKKPFYSNNTSWIEHNTRDGGAENIEDLWFDTTKENSPASIEIALKEVMRRMSSAGSEMMGNKCGCTFGSSGEKTIIVDCSDEDVCDEGVNYLVFPTECQFNNYGSGYPSGYAEGTGTLDDALKTVSSGTCYEIKKLSQKGDVCIPETNDDNGNGNGNGNGGLGDDMPVCSDDLDCSSDETCVNGLCNQTDGGPTLSDVSGPMVAGVVGLAALLIYFVGRKE